jgi:copper(I)-binding protein
MKLRKRLLIPLLFLAACSRGSKGVVVRDAWIRPADSGMNTAAYFVLESTEQEDRLMSAKSTIAEGTEIHRSYVDDAGVMRMQQISFVALPANESIRFEPGGVHIMFIELTRDLALDEQIQLLLLFEKQGELTIDVPVESR